MRAVCSRGVPYVGGMGPFVVTGPTTMDVLVRGCWALVWLAARPCLVQWWAGLGPGAADCLVWGVLGLVLVCWQVGKTLALMG